MATAVSAEIGNIRSGQIVEFMGYSSPEVEPVFTAGERVRIEHIDEVEQSMQAVSVDRPQVGDTVFIEEINVLETEASEAVSEDADGGEEEVSLAVAAASSKFPRKTEKVKSKASAKAKTTAKAKPVAKAAAKTPAKPEKVKAIKQRPTPVVEDEQADLIDMLDTSEPEKVVSDVELLPSTELVVAPAVHTFSEVVTEAGRVSDSDRVANILAQQDALDAAKALVAQAEETYFTLGGVLSHIYYEGIHKTLGYDGKRGFEAYVEKELGVAYRKAMYLIDIYTKFRSLGVDERRLSQIGWSKAKELTRFATTDNFDELVTAASSKSREELIEHLRSSYVNAEGGASVEQARRVKLNFSLFADQAETVTRALDASKERANTDNLSIALEAICAEWLQLSEGIEVPLEDAVRHIELRYGVRLVPQSAAEAQEPDVASAVQ